MPRDQIILMSCIEYHPHPNPAVKRHRGPPEGEGISLGKGALRENSFLLRGNSFLLRGNSFLLRGKEFPRNSLLTRYSLPLRGTSVPLDGRVRVKGTLGAEQGVVFSG
jgi:hypothetical protein